MGSSELVQVELADQEMAYVQQCAREIHDKIVSRGAQNQFWCTDNSFYQRLESLAAEAAVAKYFNVFWDGGRFGDVDVGSPGAGVEVRWRGYNGQNLYLILNPDDATDETVYMCVTGCGKQKVLRGFITGRKSLDVRHDGWYMPSGRPGWWIAVDNLDRAFENLTVCHPSGRTWESIFGETA